MIDTMKKLAIEEWHDQVGGEELKTRLIVSTSGDYAEITIEYVKIGEVVEKIDIRIDKYQSIKLISYLLSLF